MRETTPVVKPPSCSGKTPHRHCAPKLRNPPRHRFAFLQPLKKNGHNIVIPEFSAWLTLVLERRGKYPESPAPAGSHALISRTPTPGGMLHANLGLPRPPPRNPSPPATALKQTQKRPPKPKTPSPAPPQGGVPSLPASV